MSELKMYDTRGAMKRYRCSDSWIHRLVDRGDLPAHVFDAQGEIVRYDPGQPRQGQGLIFLPEDFAAYDAKPKRGRGRQRGHKVVKKALA